MSEKRKTLAGIWADLRPGDIVLFQEHYYHGGKIVQMDEPILSVIVGIDFWDMAYAVHYVPYKSFDVFKVKEQKWQEVESFGEWSSYWLVLGHWKQFPALGEMKKAFRSKEPSFTPIKKV